MHLGGGDGFRCPATDDILTYELEDIIAVIHPQFQSTPFWNYQYPICWYTTETMSVMILHTFVFVF